MNAAEDDYPGAMGPPVPDPVSARHAAFAQKFVDKVDGKGALPPPKVRHKDEINRFCRLICDNLDEWRPTPEATELMVGYVRWDNPCARSLDAIRVEISQKLGIEDDGAIEVTIECMRLNETRHPLLMFKFARV